MAASTFLSKKDEGVRVHPRPHLESIFQVISINNLNDYQI